MLVALAKIWMDDGNVGKNGCDSLVYVP